MGKLFGTDGVRGVANESLTPELAFNLGRAGAYVLTKANKHAPKIIIGTDTRVSGDMLESALTAGMCSVGATVYHAGVIPTPGIAYLVRKYGLDAGVVISASHNPFPDNGIKFFNGDGYKLPDALENEIEEVIESKMNELPRPTAEGVGKQVPCETAVDDYVDFLASTMNGVKLNGLKVAMDCANGAAYVAAPKVFEKLGAHVFVIHNKPDGTNINNECGSTHMGSLVEYVKETGANIGVAFDGDSDRCLFVDETGKIVEGDEVMSICGHYMREAGELKGDTIVATVMSNLGLSIMGKEQGITIEQTKVGDRYVLERMLEGGFSLGGEQSGHIIFLENNTTGDGILTALKVCRIMRTTGKKLSELNKLMEVLPQVLINAKVSDKKKNDYLTDETVLAEIKKLEEKYSGSGRVLIRPSGTEPKIRVMIEGKDKEMLHEDATALAQLFEKLFG